MKIHQIRNATIVLEYAGGRVLVDPMLGGVRTLPPYTLVKHRARRNPLIELPANHAELLRGVTHGLITHTHFGMDCDHLDKPGAAALKEAGAPVFCRSGDERSLAKRGLDARPIEAGSEVPFLEGTIRSVRAAHGVGVVGTLMGKGAGYIISQPGEPTVYLTGDTVLTDAVRDAVTRHSPGIIVAPLGGARLDFGGPILITLEDAMTLASMSDAVFVANHLEALNHCPVTREDVRRAARDAGIESRVKTPADGETLEFAGGDPA